MTEKTLKNSPVLELTDISTKIKYGLNMLSVIHFAVNVRMFQADVFLDSLFTAWAGLSKQVEKLDKLTDEMKEQIRRETK